MTTNRAGEFLEAALQAYPLLRDRQMRTMKLFVELARDEVSELVRENQELRQQLAERRQDLQPGRVALLTGINGAFQAVDGRRQTVDGVVRMLENVR